MKPEQIEKLHHSFSIQAPAFEAHLAKEEYLKYALSVIRPRKEDTLLEAAAGTCVCGRTFAPLVRNVVCLDATLPMLQIGKQEADKNQLDNMIFVKGYVEELPFLNHSFSLVFSRLAFHHFVDPGAAFSEMTRVLEPGGRLILIDMEAADEPLRAVQDEIETLRDPSHVRNLSRQEMQELFTSQELSICTCETKAIPQRLDDWLSLTQTPETLRRKILLRMQADLEGRKKTGFSPYVKDGEVFFDQRWVLTIGRK